MLCGQYPTKSEGKELKIMVQPETQHRARYLTEGSRGSVKDRTQQGFPTVKVGWARALLPRAAPARWACTLCSAQGAGVAAGAARGLFLQVTSLAGITELQEEGSCMSRQGFKIWDARSVRLQFHGLCECRDIPYL